VSLVDLHDLLLHFEHLNLRFHQVLSLALGPSSPRVVIGGFGLDRCSDGGWNAGFLRNGFPAPHGNPGSISPLSDSIPFIQISLFSFRYPVFVIQFQSFRFSRSDSVVQIQLFRFVIQISLLILRYSVSVVQSSLFRFGCSAPLLISEPAWRYLWAVAPQPRGVSSWDVASDHLLPLHQGVVLVLLGSPPAMVGIFSLEV